MENCRLCGYPHLEDSIKPHIKDVPLPIISLKPVPQKSAEESVSSWVEKVCSNNPSAEQITYASSFLFRPESLILVESIGDIKQVEIQSWKVGLKEYLHTPTPLVRWLQRDIAGFVPCINIGEMLIITLQLDPFATEKVELKLALRGTVVEYL